MAGTLSLSSTVEVFPCPHCGETINTSLSQCSFCKTTIDHEAAKVSAAATSKISQASSDASYLRIMAWGLLTSVLVMFVPFLGLAGVAGLWFLRIAIPVMVIRWWVKFGSIETSDHDFWRAKQSTIIISIVAVLALASVFIKTS